MNRKYYVLWAHVLSNRKLPNKNSYDIVSNELKLAIKL